MCRTDALSSSARFASTQRGFTLLEISIVLVIIGLIVGAISVGKDLQRNASYQKMNSVFIQGWRTAYDTHFERVGIVVGDNPAAPTLQVNQGGAQVCGQALVRTMEAAGITTPTGRSPGNESLYVYLDANGNPQEAAVCFQNINWSVPNGAGGFQTRLRNVMIITGLTPDLARYVDAQTDGRTDARYGQVREQAVAANVQAPSIGWTINALTNINGNLSAVYLDESQLGVMTAVYLMGN